MKEVKVYEYVCLECGTPGVGKRWWTKFCSKRCRNSWNARESRRAVCPDCGKEFVIPLKSEL